MTEAVTRRMTVFLYYGIYYKVRGAFPVFVISR